uniref:Uncharacterized protein n=1 Tax=Ciona savignyi TaxID=51511 RepID=H2Z0F5_CIOSA
MRTQQEIAEAYSKLHQLNQQFQVKLKTAVDQEKHKSVLEKMKNEEELQNLCFSVRDETMKVQKEMKTFNDNISKQLELLIGFKGKLFDESSPAKLLKRRRRTTGGLLSVVNTENEGGVGVQKPVPPLAGGGMLNQGFMDPNMGMMGGMGGPMGGFGGEMMMMGPGIMGPGMMGPGMMGPGMMDPNMNNGENQNEEEEIGKGNVDYWKNLKSALGGKPPKKEEDPVPTETPKRNPLVARVLAEKQRRLSIVTNPAPDVSSGGAMGSLSSSSSGCSDGFRDYLDMVDPEMAELMRTLRPSAGTLSEEQKKENTSLESSNEIVRNPDNSQGSNDVGERKLPEKSEESHNESKKDTSISIRVPEIKSDNCENAPPTVSEIKSVEVEKTEDGKKSGSPIVAITPAPELRDVLIVSDDDNDESPPPRGPLLTVVDRRMARIGNRRRSSVIPFRNVMQIARRQSIRPPPPPKVVKFKGFYNEFGNPFRSKTELEKKRDALSREAAVRRRKEQLEEQERERRRARKKAIAATTGIDDDPVKQAEVFVRNISQQVNNFFSGMNDNLVDAIQRNNSKMESKVWIIENELQKVR